MCIVNLTNEQISFVIQTPAYLYAKEILEPYRDEINGNSFSIALKSIKEMEIYSFFIEACLKYSYHRDFWLFPCYTEKKFLCISKEELMREIIIDLPYSARSKYFPFVEQVDRILGQKGNMYFFINNIPYSPELKLCIVCRDTRQIEKIETVISEQMLTVNKSQSLENLIEEAHYRHWNMYEIPLGCTIEQLTESEALWFLFPEIETLKEKGYNLEKHFTKPKVFISYCHKNREIVDKFTSALRKTGINYWIDYVDLESGIPLVNSIMSSIKECDLAITFISTATLHSGFASTELSQILTQSIQKGNKWCFVRLDNVDVDQILPGLSMYYYIDYHNDKDIHKLVQEVSKKLKRQELNSI